MATDFAATSATGTAPVVTSASYTFIARDVGHWVYVKSGTNLVAATTTTFTSAGNPVGKNMVGNLVSITSGTGWVVARWEVSSVTGTTGTAANFSTGSTIATASSTGGTGGLGGPLASPG
jgi:hypothetical protein